MSSLPSYVATAKPVPAAKRTSWWKTIAPTYASVMLWFVFWQDIVKGHGEPGGALSQGIGTALLGLVIAGLICHFLFFLVPGLLGMKTGLPLYVVGTSTYGVVGGLLMPGLLMGLLQFGWLGVNAFAVSKLLCECFGSMQPGADKFVPSNYHTLMAAVFAFAAAFIGLKGIHYVAKVATYFPLIPLVVLLVLLAKTAGGLGSFDPNPNKMSLETAPPAAMAMTVVKADVAKPEPPKAEAAKPLLPLTTWGVLALLSTYVVGFFATAGAAGADVASNNRNASDVQWGGLTGITLATIVAGGLSMLIVAGAYGCSGLIPGNMSGNLNPLGLMNGCPKILHPQVANVFMILLAISSFAGACFSTFIAATSFKTSLPQINPFVSVGLGALAATVLAATGWAGQVLWVFQVIGASFGPVCGAMMADYLLSGRKWAGPRAGFNPAGWISWILGFAVGGFNLVAELFSKQFPALADLHDLVPVPPVAAFIVGFVVYLVLAKLGLESQSREMPAAAK
jgi:cytosine permease